MPSSTISLESVFDTLAAKGVPDPRGLPSGYGDTLALELGSETMADLLAGAINARGELTRFNWKFNRAAAVPFQLNSWQQDYPQPAQGAGPIGWGEDCDICDINNTTMPKPLNWDGAVTWKKQLSRTSLSRWRPSQICWMYNNLLSYGTWPGAHVTYYPLLTLGSNPQNPIMSMVDGNGNLLIVTGPGTTGTTAPLASTPATLTVSHIQAYGVAVVGGNQWYVLVTFTSAVPVFVPGQTCTFSGLTVATALNGKTLAGISPAQLPTGIPVPSANQAVFAVGFDFELATADSGTGIMLTPIANAAEGTTVTDGSVTWSVVSPTSQGFRVDWLPNASSPNYQLLPYFQLEPPKFTRLGQMLNPIPDSFSRHFFRGLEAAMYAASPNPGDAKRGQMAKADWLQALVAMTGQGNKEPDAYSLVPMNQVVERRWQNGAPYTADQPI